MEVDPKVDPKAVLAIGGYVLCAFSAILPACNERLFARAIPTTFPTLHFTLNTHTHTEMVVLAASILTKTGQRKSSSSSSEEEASSN
jgi:hypothetical protein